VLAILREARELALAARKQLHAGINPLAARGMSPAQRGKWFRG
jgi:hypothetical protein